MDDPTVDPKLTIRGVYPVDARPPAGLQTVKPDSIDTFAFHLAVIGIAILIGYLTHEMFVAIEKTNQSMKDLGFLSSIPLFPLCMGGGILLQWLLERYDSRFRLIDATVMERISGSCLDFLITAAVASVKLSSISNNLAPFLLLIVVGFGWVCITIPMAKHFVPDFWFERAICEFGMNTGVIASGLVLLRMCDPESETAVPADFAYKQLGHSPFMGGGLWTAIAIPLIFKLGIWITIVIVTVVLFLWVCVAVLYWRPIFRRAAMLGDPLIDTDDGATVLDEAAPSRLLVGSQQGASVLSPGDTTEIHTS